MKFQEEFTKLNVEKIYILRNIKPGEKEGEEIVETVQKTVHKLPEIIRKTDGIFVMNRRIGDIAIYRKIASYDGEISYDHFDVIKIKVVGIRDLTVRSDNSKDILYFKEIYPASDELGVYKWVFHTKISTNKKFNELLRG